MSKNSKRMGRWLVIATIIGFFCLTETRADKPVKPDKPPEPEPTSPAYRVQELPVEGNPIAISEANAANTVTAAIDGKEQGYRSAAFARVDANSGAVLDSGFLPEPPFLDPNDGVMKNGGSEPNDVNVFGDIVGHAQTYDPEAAGHPSPPRAILWTDNGSGYEYTLLPLPPGAGASYARGVNTWGDIVGSASADSTGQNPRAVLWDGETGAVVDLNTLETALLGWELVSATDINDNGLIVGSGWLGGFVRGFHLDTNTGEITIIPLLGPATGGEALGINSAGRVIGFTWNGNGNLWGTNPDFVVGYSWDGPGIDPVELTPVTLITSIARDLNDLGATTGNSYLPNSDLFDHPVPTLWEFGEQGNVVATDLQMQIPDKPSYTLLSAGDINNDGWIGAEASKFSRGKYTKPAVLLIPDDN